MNCNGTFLSLHTLARTNFYFDCAEVEQMLGVCRILRLCQNPPRGAIFQPFQGNGIPNMNKICSNFGCVTSSSLTQQKGLENVTVTEVLMTKGEENIGSWLWCRTDDAVINAMKNVR